MKFFRNIRRYFRDAMKSVIRNFSLSLASISCIAITLIVVGISIVLSYNVENMTDSIKKDVTMVVFLKSDTTEDEVKDIQKKITNMGNIEEIKFKSKKEYAEETKERDEVFSFIVDNWTDETNPLLDSFLIKVKEVEEIKNTASSIKKIDKVELVNYGEDMVDQLITVFDVIRKVSIGAVVALILVTAFLIANTIKLAIFSRKTEIEIMRLVGASNISIKIPFIIEGSFIGILGSIIPIILMIYGYTSLYNYFDGKLFGSSLAMLIEPYPFIYLSSLLLLGIGIVVGMFGSYSAVKKYLKI
ncbi:MAG: permease-like cell division protein FtsX [Bacilli bacterium]|jgi:cell division transport system permease protein|nr:permease-like cell division protein FtsX [Clostridium sp.]MDY3797715.1 permease-like cell division protein FtsX [Bacilli bacterium]CDE95648.1 cell division protein [Clostridium sp. CAG:914]